MYNALRHDDGAIILSALIYAIHVQCARDLLSPVYHHRYDEYHPLDYADAIGWDREAAVLFLRRAQVQRRDPAEVNGRVWFDHARYYRESRR